MADDLASLSPAELAGFYRRLADSVDKNKGALQVSLAALLMRHWLENRDPKGTFVFAAPDHLKSHSQVIDVLAYHRRVYLTEEEARVGEHVKRWAGIVPRLQGRPPYQRWDGKVVLTLDYESLVEFPLRYQVTGNAADRDILYALHGFQLKTYITVAADKIPSSTHLKILFRQFEAEIRDRYDWDYSEHLTVPNPDYRSQAKGAVSPTSDKVVVYHRHAKRLEDAGLAAPYDLRTDRWTIADARFTAPGEVDPGRKL
jgi:hypothetical protein